MQLVHDLYYYFDKQIEIENNLEFNACLGSSHLLLHIIIDGIVVIAILTSCFSNL